MQPVISVKNLTQRYPGGRLIYENLSFDVPQGRILGLLGKNGTGKTTTINILMGYLKPLAGECRIFGQDITALTPETRARIALLIEGHVQYAFMTIAQIERFYSKFYPKWNRDAYYELMSRLKVTPNQKISSMSCGQRSQVALGLILAQNADLLVLDDFSLGLDPGYRRLFVDYLKEYVSAEDKTVFMTSHIIQDMERLIDDCIILDYGKILTQMPVSQLMDTFHCYHLPNQEHERASDLIDNQSGNIINPSMVGTTLELFSFSPKEAIEHVFKEKGLNSRELAEIPMTLEDAFIGLTGKY
ncbi:MAG: ABC transporter ATP-binding protein [Bacteroidales bacterium]|nr:ABC transporter ATP-binding protein [Bacteroidales bacterium]